MADQKLEQLKLKYQSVLNKMTALHVQLKNLHVENGKLVLKGHAKTKGESNQVWEQIKLVDPNYQSDLAAQFTYDSDAPAATTHQPANDGARTYTVKRGDTLSEIAKEVYGSASEYRKIFAANRDQLSDPDEIRPGQVLKIPA